MHYLPPASIPLHPVQTMRPTAGKWIFLQRSSDKKEQGRKREKRRERKKGMKTERQQKHPQPASPRISSISPHQPVCYLSFSFPVGLIRAALYIRGLYGSVTFFTGKVEHWPKAEFMLGSHHSCSLSLR